MWNPKYHVLFFLDDHDVAQLPAFDYQYQETELYSISAELSIHGHELSESYHEGRLHVVSDYEGFS